VRFCIDKKPNGLYCADYKAEIETNNERNPLMAGKLHQTIAVESGIKTRVERFLTDSYKNLQKAPLFDGLVKTFEKKEEDGDDVEPKRQLVQQRAEELLQEIATQMTEYIDIVATKDYANCSAKADVVMDDNTVVLKDVPVTHLLFLEKKLVDINTAVAALPELDTAYDWTRDDALGLYRSAAVRTTATKKVPETIVLHPPTKEHPAQTQLIQKEVPIGTWTTVRQSGAVTAQRKKQLQRRCQQLLLAIKRARSAANDAEAPRQRLGSAVFGYLLAE